jgi:hypothetical protein
VSGAAEVFLNRPHCPYAQTGRPTLVTCSIVKEPSKLSALTRRENAIYGFLRFFSRLFRVVPSSLISANNIRWPITPSKLSALTRRENAIYGFLRFFSRLFRVVPSSLISANNIRWPITPHAKSASMMLASSHQPCPLPKKRLPHFHLPPLR